MLKRCDHQKRRKSISAFCVSKLAIASGLLIAIATTEATFAQAPQVVQANRSALGTGLPTETKPSLSLQEAIALAMDGNPELAVAKREIEASQGQVIQGQLRRNPELAYSQEDQQAATRTQTVLINLPIETGGKRAARIRVAERGRDIAVEELNVRRVEVRAAVVTAFFDALAAQERAALAMASVDLAKRATDVVAKRVIAGKVSPVEETKARVAQAGVQIELAQAQSEQRSARTRLISLLGANAPSFNLVVGSVEALPVVPSIDIIEQGVSASPALRRTQLELERRRSQVDVERSKALADVTFSLGVKRPREL